MTKKEDSKKKKLVQMRMPVPILEKLANIERLTYSENRTQAVVFSVILTEKITEAVSNGEKFYIERSDGSKECVRFIF